MSIERMEHVTVLVPAAQKAKLVEWLFARREIHVEPFGETSEEWRERFAPLEEDAGHAESQSSQMGFVVSFLLEHTESKPDFLTSVFPVRIRASKSDIRKAAESVDTEKIHTTCQELRGEIEAAEEERERLHAEMERLGNLAFLKVDIGALRAMKHVAVMIASAPSEASARFVEDERVLEKISVDAGSETKRSKVYILAAAAADAALLKEIATDYGLREYQIPKISGTIEEAQERLKKELADLAAKEEALAASARELAGDIRVYQLALSWWESENTRLSQQAMLVSSANVFAARGYVKRSRLERLRLDMEEAIPEAAVMATKAPEGEEPPVSLKWSRFVRPAGLLVNMFGLPKYSTFDPTPFVMFTFIVFFGMCFGDLLYGAMLIGVAALLKRKFKDQPGLIEFFRLFTYTGISTMIFGVLTGSWGSDLTSYFGEGNPVDALRVKLTLLEPLQKPMVALGIAVGLGVVNQFYGLILRFLSHAWRGDAASGFYDGGLWLIYFSSLLSLAFTGAGILPGWLMSPSLWVLALSALGLVLTQGREAENWPTRLVTGTISLYGILGSYGTTAFIGDVLSYSRLLALGLTTSVIGMAFNIISGFLKDIPYAGWGLFLAVCLAGHSFNFVMSILGAFVHPARLIFLEFFGRFYEGGGSPFRPFGFASSNVELTE